MLYSAMKKLSAKKRRWHQLRASNQWKRTHRRKAGRGQLRNSLENRVQVTSRGRRSFATAPEGIPLPRVFCFEQNRSETLKALQDLRRRIRRPDVEQRPKAQRKVPNRLGRWFDIGTIEYISPSAALVLASEFDRSRRLSGNNLYAINVSQWHSSVRETLSQIGFLKLLGVELNQEEIKEEGGVRLLTIQSGDKVYGEQAGEFTRYLAQLVVAAGMDSLPVGAASDEIVKKVLLIYVALIEAMDNAIQHAYPGEQVEKHPASCRWWLTGAYDPKTRMLTVVLYDQGVSIPVTIPEWRNFNGFTGIFRALTGLLYDHHDPKYDGQALQAAVETATSRTQQLHRGKGLGLMKSLLDNFQDGQLMIMSRSGLVVQRKNWDEMRCENMLLSLDGTLVEWSVRID